jgi:hypothetical protein
MSWTPHKTKDKKNETRKLDGFSKKWRTASMNEKEDQLLALLREDMPCGQDWIRLSPVLRRTGHAHEIAPLGVYSTRISLKANVVQEQHHKERDFISLSKRHDLWRDTIWSTQ